MSNPIWAAMLAALIHKRSLLCPHCKKTGMYPTKKNIQEYRCHHCGKRFGRKEPK